MDWYGLNSEGFSRAKFDKDLAQARAGVVEKSELRKLRGTDALSFSEREVDLSKNLLGNRWLSHQCGCFLVAPSGHGKSTLIMQMVILWCCGRPAFGIRPAQPLRILLIEAEDDDNDITEMAWMVRRLNLSDTEKHMLKTNSHIEWLSDVNYIGFFEALDDFLAEFPCDILIINPYSAYQGGDIRDEERNNDFLRDALSKLMAVHHFGTLLVHHTPKTNFQKTEEYSWFDWMYIMAGTASITNWARGVLVLNPTKVTGTYQFIAAKRFEKLGWTQREAYWSHSVQNGIALWIPSTTDQIRAAKPRTELKPEDLLDLFPLVDGVTMHRYLALATSRNLGVNKARRFLELLIEDQLVKVTETPREGTNALKTYCRSK